jgi:RecB family exonuclease
MKTSAHFLDHLADRIAESPEDQWKSHLVILPSQRAGLHLRHALIRRANKAFIHPHILTTESFVRELSGSRRIDPVRELSMLFSAYCATHQRPEGFDAFMKWAPLFLSDLNEADRHLAPMAELYRFTSDVKRLERWSAEEEEDRTDMIRSYLHFWERLDDMRCTFQELCQMSGLIPQGLAYRMAAEGFSQLWPEWKKSQGVERIWIAGLNALNKAEEEIFAALRKEECVFLFDLPEILGAGGQEAGQFIRQYLKWEKTSAQQITPSDHIREWTISSTPGQQEQYALVREILEGLIEEKGMGVLERTALVLTEESDLLPALSALPEAVKKVNITMGLPLKDHPMTQIISRLMQLLASDWQTGASADLLRDLVLSLHPLVGPGVFTEPEWALGSRIDRSEWKQFWTNGRATELNMEPPPEPVTGALELGTWLVARLPEGMNKSCLEEILQQLKELQRLQKEILKENGSDIKDVERLFRLLMKDAQLDFRGEPLEGLQIMGILESRALEFDHVLFTSLNEGCLPKGRPVQSMFPYELRKAHGLPDHGEKDSIYGYHFLRLLARSKRAWMIYSMGSDGVQASEPSRFLLQIRHEWTKWYDSQLQLDSEVRIAPPSAPQAEERIAKTPAILDSLDRLRERGFSPSALNRYLKNPIDFYLNYCSGIREPKRKGRLDSLGMGLVFHEAIDRFFKPFLQQELNAELLELEKKRIPACLEEACEKYEVSAERLSGTERLAFDLLPVLVEKSVHLDITLLRKGHTIELLALEESLSASLNERLTIKGKVDRIDRVDGVVRVIDYKTGNISSLGITDAEQLTDGEHAAAFQLMIYALMAQGRFPDEEFNACIYLTKEWSKGPKNLSFGENKEKTYSIDADRLIAFRKQLIDLIEEILDPTVDFVHLELHEESEDESREKEER